VVRAQWLLPHDEADAVMAEPHVGLTLAHSLSPVMPDTSFVNVTAAGVDKGAAVRRVAKAYGVPLERAMMVGDGQNDVSTMRIVGAPVAMGNAEPAALAAARYTVGSVDDDGLVEAFALAATL
jgi:hydroxymethylpyrimidine pyrophosphatase-like HAD family hydrolase